MIPLQGNLIPHKRVAAADLDVTLRTVQELLISKVRRTSYNGRGTSQQRLPDLFTAAGQG
jgi:hypothetical protein